MTSPVPPPRRRQVTLHLRPSAALRVLRPWWFAAATAAVMLFIAYGSFVPFDYQPKDRERAAAEFRTALDQWADPPSKSDFAANVALGVPFAFCLLGALRVDRPRRWLTAVVGVGVVAVCGGYAAAVEFTQLFFRDRVCSGADITAQAIGGAAGATAWVIAGPWATDRLRRAFDSDGVRHTTAPLLVAYAGLLLVILTLPLDLTASPTELFKRLRDQTNWVPLGELFDRPGASGEHDLKVVAGWCELLALHLPVGLLAGGLAGQFRSADGLFRVLGLGLAAGLIGEACQVLVKSRHPSLTDVLLAAVGVTVGWATARLLTGRGVRKRRAEVALLLGQGWAAVLAVVAWHPYQFFPAVTGERLGAMSWLPLRDAVRGQYLWAAEDLLAKFALAVPLGAVVAWGLGGSPPGKRWVVWLTAVAVTGLVTAGLELGQAMLPARTVCPTDVLLAAAGGWAGAAVTRRLLK